MTTQTAFDDRLSALEQEVANIKQRLNRPNGKETWLDRVSGSMEQYPEFGEVLRLGKEIREADRPADDN